MPEVESFADVFIACSYCAALAKQIVIESINILSVSLVLARLDVQSKVGRH